jgi:hypothetical protein
MKLLTTSEKMELLYMAVDLFKLEGNKRSIRDIYTDLKGTISDNKGGDE